MLTLRTATADAAAISGIYRPYIDTPITFETVPPSADDFAGRIAHTLKNYPYLVCEDGGVVVGYAYAARQHMRAACDWNAELSVYIAESHHGRGLGSAFYTALLEILTRQHVVTAYASVSVPHEKSIALHTALGFTPFALFPRMGYKCGAWRDLQWLRKPLADDSKTPEAFVPFPQLDKDEVARILSQTEAFL